jgi:hypothetical protein
MQSFFGVQSRHLKIFQWRTHVVEMIDHVNHTNELHWMFVEKHQ